MPPSRGGLLLQGRVLLGLEFYLVYLPFLLVHMLQATGGGFGTSWFPYLLLACLFWAVCLPGLGPCPFVCFSLPFFGELSFYKVWQGFIIFPNNSEPS